MESMVHFVEEGHCKAFGLSEMCMPRVCCIMNTEPLMKSTQRMCV